MFFNDKIPQYKILRKITYNITLIIFINKKENPLSNQGILFNKKVYELIFFERSTTNLNYEFNKNVYLKFYIRDNDIILRIINPNIKIDKTIIWEHNYIMLYPSLSWNKISKEYDYINVISYEYSLKNKHIN